MLKATAAIASGRLVCTKFAAINPAHAANKNLQQPDSAEAMPACLA